MGIVTLALAIFPAFGITAYQMFRGEVPGPTAERLKPGLTETAKILWGVYAVLTLAETLLLFLGGMSLFESFCQAFGTMATGGFSTRNASIAAFNSDYIDWVIIVFMFFAGMNFMIHYRVLFSGSFRVVRTNREFHFYALVIGAAIVATVALLMAEGLTDRELAAGSFRYTPLSEQALNEKLVEEGSKIAGVYGIVRHAAFQVISLTTTTGFATADFDVWPNALRIMLVVLMFFGGSAGSTGGGIKMVRIMVVLKTAWREVRTMIQPRLIAPVKIAGRALEEKQVANITGFFVLFIVLFVMFTLVMSLIIADFTTAVTSVVATICNIGPGLSGIGATENYSWIPLSGKWILTACMLLGRLEVYTVIIAFAPISWRR
ncbi:MAG: TrkH family potassium uptake protein [Chitinivibrionales bacterium]|nr:TrkH family potassium uptake protein [Chitinivibrionales bacterium]MBD3358580.1 TrkH family potassium uptake protein [Chitinivibrionales bacterium]